jgi:hypothetical protein
MVYGFEKKVVEIFKLNAFRAGPHGSINPATNKYVTDIEVDFLWAAYVYYFSRPVVVAVMESQSKFKGFLYDEEEKVDRNAVIVHLENWNDPVENALHSMDLAPRIHMSWQIHTLQILVSTNTVQSNLYITMDIPDTSSERLSQAVLEVINTFAALYGSKDWQWLLQSRREDE